MTHYETEEIRQKAAFELLYAVERKQITLSTGRNPDPLRSKYFDFSVHENVITKVMKDKPILHLKDRG